MGDVAKQVAGVFGIGPKGNGARIKNLQKGALDNKAQADAALAPPALPAAPDTASAYSDAGAAITAAANRYRKQRGGGFGSTILSGPNGGAPAQTARKGLLGL